MEHDILDQIRVVSKGYPFPIWINNQPIILKLGTVTHTAMLIFIVTNQLCLYFPYNILVSSEPPARWVLLVKDTYVEFQPPSSGTGSSQSTPTSSLLSPFPERTSSGGSSHSEFSEIFSSVSQQPPLHRRQSNQPGYPQHRRHSSQSNTSMFCLPDVEDGVTPGGNSVASSQDETYSIMSTIPQMMQNWLGGLLRRSDPPHTQLMKEERRSSDESGKRDKHSFPSNVSPYKTYHSGMRIQHGRQLSWHSSTQKEVAERKHLPLFVPTPELDAPLRVEALPQGEDLPWPFNHCFDVYTHPLTLPDLYQTCIANQSEHQKEPFCLVRLSPAGSVTTSCQSEGKRDPFVKADGQVASPSSERSDISPLSEGKMDEKERDILVQVVAGLWRGLTQSTTAADSRARPKQQQTSPPNMQCQVAVARLIFATHIQFGKRSTRSSSLEEAVSRENSCNSSPEAPCPPTLGVTVLPGHILMSDLLRQQLGLKVNSAVRLLHVKEQWRILCCFYRVSITLTPLTNMVSV